MGCAKVVRRPFALGVGGDPMVVWPASLVFPLSGLEEGARVTFRLACGSVRSAVLWAGPSLLPFSFDP